MQTIEDIVKQLEDIKYKYGNLCVGQIFSYEDFLIDIGAIAPCVVSNPIDKTKYMVIFD